MEIKMDKIFTKVKPLKTFFIDTKKKGMQSDLKNNSLCKSSYSKLKNNGVLTNNDAKDIIKKYFI